MFCATNELFILRHGLNGIDVEAVAQRSIGLNSKELLHSLLHLLVEGTIGLHILIHKTLANKDDVNTIANRGFLQLGDNTILREVCRSVEL